MKLFTLLRFVLALFILAFFAMPADAGIFRKRGCSSGSCSASARPHLFGHFVGHRGCK